MPRAAPGENAIGVLRRKLPEYRVVPGGDPSRRPVVLPSRQGMEGYFHPLIPRSILSGAFTQLLSVYMVERGRLGKVVSLVGDCRPPPPGNPHRPTSIHASVDRIGGWHTKEDQFLPGEVNFGTTKQINGGKIFSARLHISFNNLCISSNLKILNSTEYFKKNRSYFYCTGKKPVLKFGSFRLPHIRVNRRETPIYSDYKCSRNAGMIYALSVL